MRGRSMGATRQGVKGQGGRGVNQQGGRAKEAGE